MKKIITVLLCLLLLVTCFAVPAAAEEGTAVDQEEYYPIDLSTENMAELEEMAFYYLLSTLKPGWNTSTTVSTPDFSFDLDQNGENDISLKQKDVNLFVVERESGADYFIEPQKIRFSEKFIGIADCPAIGVEINLVRKHSVTVSKEGNGTASSDITEGVKGTKVTLSYNADAGWGFQKWEVVSGSAVGFDNNTFTIGTDNVEVKAVFKKAFKVKVKNDGNGTGQADLNEGIEGTEVNLQAMPKNGYTFKRWEVISGGVTLNGNKFIIGTEDVTVKAVFDRIPDETPVATVIYPVKIVLTVEGNGTCKADYTDDGTGTVKTNITEGYKGNVVTLTAEPDKGYDFSEWEVISGGVNVIDNKFTIGTETVKIKAVFKKKTIDISKATVILAKKSYTYKGKSFKPAVTSMLLQDDSEIKDFKDFTISYKDNKNAGTATVTITAKDGSGYTGKVTAKFKITKAAQKFKTVAPLNKTYKAVALASKSQTFTVKATLKKGDGKVTFKKTNGSNQITITKDGKVTVKKGTKIKTYYIKVKITAAATQNYKSKTVTKKIKVVVK